MHVGLSSSPMFGDMHISSYLLLSTCIGMCHWYKCIRCMCIQKPALYKLYEFGRQHHIDQRQPRLIAKHATSMLDIL